MGTVFRKKTQRAVPPGAEIHIRDGKRLARWKVRGKSRTAEVVRPKKGNWVGQDRIVTESRT
jgi:hypothetical protein